MMKKEYLILSLLMVISVIGFSLFFIFKNKKIANTIIKNIPTTTFTTSISEEITTTTVEILRTINNSQTYVSPSTISITQETKEKFYTMKEVNIHNSKESCWTVIRENVYDLTQFISKHPGGEDKILSLCGKNGTQAFIQKHGGKEKPEKTLEKFKIGTLKYND